MYKFLVLYAPRAHINDLLAMKNQETQRNKKVGFKIHKYNIFTFLTSRWILKIKPFGKSEVVGTTGEGGNKKTREYLLYFYWIKVG